MSVGCPSRNYSVAIANLTERQGRALPNRSNQPWADADVAHGIRLLRCSPARTRRAVKRRSGSLSNIHWFGAPAPAPSVDSFSGRSWQAEQASLA